MTLSLLLYNFLLLISAPIWLSALAWTNTRRGGHPFGEGLPAGTRRALAGKRTVWMHCASAGEAAVGALLHERLSALLPGFSWVFTAATPAGRAALRRRLGESGTIGGFQLDLPWIVRRTLEDVHPELLILVEAELWPNLLRAARRRGVKTAVVNGRVSDNSARRYLRLRAVARPLLALVDKYLMQTDLDAERIIAAGASRDRVGVAGNIKFDLDIASAGPPPAPETLGLKPGPVLVAGSTRQGEEALLLAAFTRIRSAGPAVLILAPRHLERLPEIQALLGRSGFSWGLRSAAPSAPRDVLLVDTYGELLSLYQLATVVFVGGSLAPLGGQNPIEPALAGRPVLFGPHMENFREAQRLLLEAGAARVVRSPEEIACAFQALAADPAAAAAAGGRGREAVLRNRGAAERTAAAVAALLGAGR